MSVEHDSACLDNLKHLFELTKKELGEADENIRKLTGRDPDNFTGEVAKGQFLVNKRRPQLSTLPDKPFPGKKRPLFPIVKTKKETHEEDSQDEEEIPAKRPSLPSTVVATPKDSKSRKETIQEQNINSKVKARNRRMFGMILGTLQKFQHDAKKMKEKDLKRAEIDQKVEAAAAEETERIKMERKKREEELFQTRREKQAQLRCLEKKMEIAELHEVWEKNEKHLLNFIMTKTEPSICFLPAKHSSKTAKCLEMSRKKVMERIQERRQKVQKAFLEVEEMYKKDNFPSDKENIGPMEEEGLNELTDPSEVQNNHQPLLDAQLNSQNEQLGSQDIQIDSQDALLDLQNHHDHLQESQNSCKEKCLQESVENVSETSKVLKNENLSCESNEDNKVSEQTDQDFEPIYD